MKRILRCCFILLLIIFNSKYSYAQREANTWYFGRYLGLDFNSGAPVPLNDGQLNTTEGVATISNSNGNLLFYTDGSIIWNRLHQVMPNGTGLFGNYSSTQSAVIVPKIGDTTRYYVFTVDAVLGTKGLNYSVVNMTLDNGKGDVELKNVPLSRNNVEKITAVRHCNNRDIWVIAHDTASNGYYSYLVTIAGVTNTPVVSHTGTVLPGIGTSSIDSSWLGYMKASPNGKRIAAAHWNVNVDVSDFDNASGIVSNTVSLYQPGDPHYLSYGIEFSPNSNLLYSTVFYTDPINAQKHNALNQYDVTLGSAAAIRASKQVISLNSDPIDTYAALQIAPDGKMYMAKRSYKHISSISNPNVYGTGCVFTSNAVAFTGTNQESSYGLPTFVQSYFYPPDSFSYVVNCPGLNTSFNYTPASNVLSVLWDFNDPVSGINNSSTANNPVHIFSAPGTYHVNLIKFTNCGTDTIKRIVNTNSISINLGPDTLVCGNTSVVLNSTAAGSTNSFVWQDGSINPTFTATTAGLYWVEATNSMGCSFRDSINVDFKPLPTFNLGADSSICAGDTLLLNATVAGANSYLWSTGAATATIQAYQLGTFWCEVNKAGCVFRDSLVITSIKPAPVVDLGNPRSLCGGKTDTLNATNSNSTYLWQDGSANPIFLATITGLYWVEVTHNSGCKKRDSVQVTFNPAPVFSLGADSSICAGDTLLLNATVSSVANYLWNTGATTSSIKAYQAGTYWCEVNNGCIFRDSLTITSIKPSPVVYLGNDTTLCEGNSLALNVNYPAAIYLWQDGSSNPTYNVGGQGTYFVQVNLNGCKRSDTIKVYYTLKPKFTLGPDQYICQGNPIVLNPVLDPAWQLSWQNGSINPTYTVTQPGSYLLSATNNCGTSSDQVLIQKGICKVFVPNAFTPNGDGTNDYFKALGTETVSSYALKIFNRYGQIVFESVDKLKGWDGKLKGMPSPGGAFVYILQYKELNSPEEVMLRGTFILIR